LWDGDDPVPNQPQDIVDDKREKEMFMESYSGALEGVERTEDDHRRDECAQRDQISNHLNDDDILSPLQFRERYSHIAYNIHRFRSGTSSSELPGTILQNFIVFLALIKSKQFTELGS
jgi:hypothetical protein